MMARSEVKLKQLQQKIGGKTDWFVLDDVFKYGG